MKVNALSEEQGIFDSANTRKKKIELDQDFENNTGERILSYVYKSDP